MNTDILLYLLLNPCGMLAAGAVMYVAGDWASTGEDGLRRFGAALAGAALISVMSFGILHRLDLFGLALGAAGFGLFVLGTTWIILSLLSFIFDALMSAMTPVSHEPKPEVPIPAKPEPEPAAEPPPPPPTREELLAAAQQRHDDTLRLLETATLGVKVAENLRQRQVVRAGFNGSGVSQNNRLVERHESSHGAYWKSYDFASNVGKQNLFEHPLGPGGEGFQHDGGEIIFNLPNGLQAYMLVDAKGKRIDKGPTTIVSDPKRPDRAVVNGLSCMSCHNQGIIEKEDQIRKHVQNNPNAFTGEEAEIALTIYPADKKLKEAFKEDAERFAKAVEKTGGKLDDKGQVIGTDPVVSLAALFEQELDQNLAAAEAGVSLAEFLKVLDRSSMLARTLGSLKTKEGTVKRDVFVAAFGDIVKELSSPDVPFVLTLLVPADAVVEIEGVRTNQSGTERTYISPPIDPAKSYVYTIKVTWKENGEDKTTTEKVRVKGGEEKIVNLRPRP